MGRAPCCDKESVKKGPWSPAEDAMLKAYIEEHGVGGNWISLPSKIGLKRCGKSCRLRWLNYLRPNIKHGGFSEEEDHLIYTLYLTIGSRWSVIAAQLPGRTDNDIKNYWNTRLKKKLLGETAKNRISSSQIHRTIQLNMQKIQNLYHSDLHEELGGRFIVHQPFSVCQPNSTAVGAFEETFDFYELPIKLPDEGHGLETPDINAEIVFDEQVNELDSLQAELRALLDGKNAATCTFQSGGQEEGEEKEEEDEAKLHEQFTNAAIDDFHQSDQSPASSSWNSTVSSSLRPDTLLQDYCLMLGYI